MSCAPLACRTASATIDCVGTALKHGRLYLTRGLGDASFTMRSHVHVRSAPLTGGRAARTASLHAGLSYSTVLTAQHSAFAHPLLPPTPSQ